MPLRPDRRTARAPLLAAAALLLAAPGCSVKKNLWQAGIPGVKTSFQVASATPRDGYLDVLLHSDAFDLRTFLPANEGCAAVVSPQRTVAYVPSGPWGSLEDADGRFCQAVGIGSLDEWRDIRPEPQGLGASPVPSAQATYRVVYRDANVVFARGRFPLSVKIGWVGFADSIAVLSNTEKCQKAIENGVSTMQYFPSGPRVLTLMSGDGLCEIQGFLLPLRGD